MKLKIKDVEANLPKNERRKRYRQMANRPNGWNTPTKRQIRRLPARDTVSGLRKQRRAVRRIMRKQGIDKTYFEVG